MYLMSVCEQAEHVNVCEVYAGCQILSCLVYLLMYCITSATILSAIFNRGKIDY